MITLILLALLLTLIQLMTPALLNSKNLDFLISNTSGFAIISPDFSPVNIKILFKICNARNCTVNLPQLIQQAS